jgi:hypothetical protein
MGVSLSHFRFYWRKSNKSLFWQSEVWFMTRKRQASRNKALLAFLIVPTTLPQLFVGFIAPVLRWVFPR